MENRNKTPFTSTNGVTPFSVYMDAESAVAPLDDVIAVLRNAHEDFHLGNRSLDKYEQFDLLNRYQTLGSILMLVIGTLERVVEDFEQVKPQKDPTTEATQSTTTGKATTTEPNTIIPEGRA